MTSFDGNVLKPVNSWTVTMAVLVPVGLSFNVLFVDTVRYSHRDWMVWVASSIVFDSIFAHSVVRVSASF